MEHCDPDSLVLSALGEPALDAGDVEHVMGCERCRAELRLSRRTVDLARGPDPLADQVVEPPAEVWHRIRSELDLAGARPPSPPVPPAAADEVGARAASRGGRGVRVLAVAAGAVVLALAAGAAGAALAGRDDGSADRLVAETDLEPLPDVEGAAGTARLVDDGDGRRLQVDVEGLADVTGYYEVWLIDPATEAMVSLGVLAPSGPVDLRVPSGLDLGDFSLVDVSDEPLDGDPTHSRVSVVRGALPPVAG